MINRMKIIIIMSLFTIALGCDPFAKTPDDFYEKTPSIELKGENVDRVSIGSNENRIIEVFGKPQKTEEIGEPKVKHLLYSNEGLRFMLDDKGKLIEYFIANQPYLETSKGIKTGDHKDKIVEAYGDHFYERVEGGMTSVGYFDKNNHLYIEFGLVEEIIQFIMVGQY